MLLSLVRTYLERKDLLDLILKEHLGHSLTSVLSLSLVCDHC